MGQGCVGERLFFPEDHHHLRGIFPTAASSQSLKEGRYGVGGAQLDHPLQFADVDAQFHGHRGASHRLDLLVLHLSLRLLPDGGGQIAVVDEEYVPLTPPLGNLPQRGGYVLRLLPGVGEHQGFAALRGVVNVFVSRIGGRVKFLFLPLRHVGQNGRRASRYQGGGILLYLFLNISIIQIIQHRRTRVLGIGFVVGGGFDVKVLNPQPPAKLFSWQFRHVGGSSRSRPQPGGGRIGVPDGGGQTDPPRLIADQSRQPRDLAKDLVATIRARQGVDLVDDDVSQIAEQADHVVAPPHQHALQGFGGDLQNPAGIAEHLLLVGACHIPVPVKDGNARLIGQFRDALKLIVDQAFQGRDIQHGNAGHILLVDLGENGKESRLRLAGRRGGGDQEIVIRIKDHPGGGDLHVMQLLPATGVDELPDKGSV